MVSLKLEKCRRETNVTEKFVFNEPNHPKRFFKYS